jgi:hypothetical protein
VSGLSLTAGLAIQTCEPEVSQRACAPWKAPRCAGVNFGGAFDTEDATIPAQVFSTDPAGALGGVRLGRFRHFNSGSLALASLDYA